MRKCPRNTIYPTIRGDNGAVSPHSNLWDAFYLDWRSWKDYEGMERETGIEPATNGLGSRDSTTELLPPGSLNAVPRASTEQIAGYQCLSP